MILQQRVTYAEIELVKNYSQSAITENLVLENITIPTKPKSGPKRKYFYNGNQESDSIPFQLLTKRPVFTIKEKHIKRYYGDPFASIAITTYGRTIDLKGDKLYLKLYLHQKSRNYNCIYFRKKFSQYSLTINLSTGNFTIGEIVRDGKHKRTSFKQNSFKVFHDLINERGIFTIKNQKFKDYKQVRKLLNSFNDDEFVKELKKYINEINKYENLTDPENSYITRGFIDFFIRKKNIKTPDEYFNLFIQYYPTEKFLKKNKRKLILSILDSFGIKNKITVKIAHENPYLDYHLFSKFCSLFGDNYTKYIANLKTESITNFLQPVTFRAYGTFYPLRARINKVKIFNEIIREKEKECMIKIVNSYILERDVISVPDFFTLFNDHFKMIEKIREYYPDIKMNAITYKTFNDEHTELSRIYALIKKAWTVEYQFDNRMVRFVEDEIITVHGDKEYTFKPIILKREEEYNEEGSFMHHCVAVYANKEESIVISLRRDNDLERVTCEYNKKTGDCLQEKYFTNKTPPEHFEEALKILKKRINKFAKQRLLNHVDFKKVKVVLNGKEVIKPASDDFFTRLVNALPDF